MADNVRAIAGLKQLESEIMNKNISDETIEIVRNVKPWQFALIVAALATGLNMFITRYISYAPVELHNILQPIFISLAISYVAYSFLSSIVHQLSVLKQELHDKNRNLEKEIVERQEAQEAAVRAHNELEEKNRQLADVIANKDKLFSIISHDLRNPFHTLLGYSEMLAERVDTFTSEHIRQFACNIHTSANRLYTLLENLLTWSRLQRGVMDYEPTVWPIKEIIDETIPLYSMTAEQKGITLVNTVSDVMTVHADKAMVKTVVRNLLSNALKFTASEGRVSVSARQQDNFLEMAISDTGQGIAHAELKMLFQPDTSLRRVGTAGEKGTGLGLVLCRELIEQHGCKIWVESEVGMGTTFIFLLPLENCHRQRGMVQ